MRREGVAVVRELQRAEAQNNGGRRLMAIAAVFNTRNRMTLAASSLDDIEHSSLRRQDGVRLIFGPGVGREYPVFFRSLPDHSCLDLAAGPRKLLPEPGSYWKVPG